MLSNFPSQEYRLDVAPVRDIRGYIKLSLDFKIHILGASWTFGLVDYQTGAGFRYHMRTDAGQFFIGDGTAPFLELSQAAFPADCRLELEVLKFGRNFLPTIQLKGIGPLTNAPALTLPDSTHLAAVVGLTNGLPAVRLKDWKLTVSPYSEALQARP